MQISLCFIETLSYLFKIDVQDILECRNVIKTVLFGQQKKVKPQRVRKFMKRQSILTRRVPLSPIVENPVLENESQKQPAVSLSNDCVKNDGEYLFNEELARLRMISLEELQIPSPAKRRKLSSCSLESKLTNNLRGMLSSPIKPMAV